MNVSIDADQTQNGINKHHMLTKLELIVDMYKLSKR